MIRKFRADRGRELHPKPIFLVTAKAYLSATFGPNISDIHDFCLHCLSVVRGSGYVCWKATIMLGEGYY